MGLESKKRKREEEEEERKAKIKRGKFDGMSRKKRRRLMTMEDTQDSMAETAKGIKRIKVRSSSFVHSTFDFLVVVFGFLVFGLVREAATTATTTPK